MSASSSWSSSSERFADSKSLKKTRRKSSKQTNRSLNQCENSYRFLFESSYDAILLAYPDGTIIAANPAACKMFGMTEDELIKAGRAGILVLDERAKLAHEEENKTGKVKTELTYRRKDGSTFEGEVTSTLFTDTDGKVKTSIIIRDITGRKRAEEALLRAKEQSELDRRLLETVLETIPLAVVIAEAQSNRLLYTNRHARKLYGFDPSRLSLAESIAKVKPKRSDGSPYPINELPLYLALHGQTVLNKELTLEQPDGTTCPIFESAAPIVDSKNNVVAAVATFEDISERKRAEEKINRQKLIQEGTKKIFQEALSTRTQEALGELCLSVAEELTQSKFGFIGEINKNKLEDIAIDNPGCDYSNTVALQGHHGLPDNLFHGLYGKVLREGKSFFTNNPANHPERIGIPEGHPPLTAFLGVPLTSGGKTIGVITVVNREGGYSQNELESLEALAPAIVEAFFRKRAEDALKQSEQRYRTLVNTSTDGIIVYKEGRFIFANPAALKLFGVPTFDELKNRSIFDFIPLEERKEVQERVAQVQAGKKIMPQERQIVRTDGKRIFVEVIGAPVYYNNEWAILTVFHNIDERKQLQHQLEEYTKNLEHLVEERTRQLKEKERLAAIGETAAMVGHDLRSPLQSIVGEVFLLKDELKTVPDSDHKTYLQESIQIIAEQASYMDKIVSDLQTFVKPVKAHKQAVQLKPLIAALLAQIDIPASVQAIMKVSELLTVQADPQLLKRVLINLVTNAVQAMPQGGELSIIAKADAKGQVKIIVEDTGVGIPEELKPKIFTPLFTTKPKGQGFGLAVCKRVIEAQGGTISFESEANKGTKFIIELPSK